MNPPIRAWLNRIERFVRVWEEEESHAGESRGIAVELIEHEHHVVEVSVVGDGDESIEVIAAGDLVFEEVIAVTGAVKEAGDFGNHGCEVNSTVDIKKLIGATDVGELIDASGGLDLAAIAAEKFCFVDLHVTELIILYSVVLSLKFA
ncbi:uncharacterized protein DS421_19g642280 [Arachis hypogaea]|uniref:Uncharacterized protein n=1 Tax=Arachis hypogaea TaxID=3818 RepID=A0A6B9V478_ARAHY|nr:uncharacterized protein DS421_19g642280 [Arachis hypogaea]